MNTSAGGASAKHSGFSAHAVHKNSAAASATALQAWRSVSRPEGSSRARVRGFFASSSRSAMRLNPSATKRAQVKASTTNPRVRHVTATSRNATSRPSSANGSANTVCGSLTKLTYRTRSDSPRKVCPSKARPPPASELNPQLLPHRINPPLGVRIHDDSIRPLAREALLFPFAGRVDPHLGPERECPARVIEHVDRPHGEAHVALGVDVVQGHPPRLLRVPYVHVLVEHDDHLGQRHQPLAPQSVHHLVGLARILLVDAHEH